MCTMNFGLWQNGTIMTKSIVFNKIFVSSAQLRVNPTNSPRNAPEGCSCGIVLFLEEFCRIRGSVRQFAHYLALRPLLIVRRLYWKNATVN